MADWVTLLLPLAAVIGVCYYFLNRNDRAFAVATLWCGGWVLLVMAGNAPEYILGEYNAGPSDRAAILSVTMLDATDSIYSPLVAAVDASLFAGLLLLGLAALSYRDRGHLLAAVGWQLFGIYWLFQIPKNLLINDTVNILFITGGFSLFAVLSYHEVLSRAWDEQLASMRFIAGASAIAGGLYFALAKLHVLGTPLIFTVANQTTVLARAFFGYHVGLAAPPYSITAEDGVIIPVTGMIGGTDIALVLACTGIEAIALFLGAILAAPYVQNPWEGWRRAPSRLSMTWRRLSPLGRCLLALSLTGPVIYVLNVLRNVAIIFLLEEHQFAGVAQSLGYTEFDFVHGILFKLFALGVLIGLSLVVFEIVPELHTAVLGLFRLVNRRPMHASTPSSTEGSLRTTRRSVIPSPAVVGPDDEAE